MLLPPGIQIGGEQHLLPGFGRGNPEVSSKHPKGRNTKDIFQRAVTGQLPPEKFAHYAAEVRRLFEKREKAMDPMLDARLSFTSSIGYRPNGLDLPAWKAVFFNPKTDDAVVNRLVASIEELL